MRASMGGRNAWQASEDVCLVQPSDEKRFIVMPPARSWCVAALRGCAPALAGAACYAPYPYGSWECEHWPRSCNNCFAGKGAGIELLNSRITQDSGVPF